jgi:hypothetical protein
MHGMTEGADPAPGSLGSPEQLVSAQRRLLRAVLVLHGAVQMLGGAVNPGVGPALFPTVQVSLRLFWTLEAETPQGRPLGMAGA